MTVSVSVPVTVSASVCVCVCVVDKIHKLPVKTTNARHSTTKMFSQLTPDDMYICIAHIGYASLPRCENNDTIMKVNKLHLLLRHEAAIF